MNIIGKTIKSIVRDQEDERLHLQFTDGTAVAFENDSFRLIRMVPEYNQVSKDNDTTSATDSRHQPDDGEATCGR